MLLLSAEVLLSSKMIPSFFFILGVKAVAAFFIAIIFTLLAVNSVRFMSPRT